LVRNWLGIIRPPSYGRLLGRQVRYAIVSICLEGRRSFGLPRILGPEADIVVSCSWGAAAVAQSQEQDQGGVLRASVNLVMVDVTVKSKAGQTPGRPEAKKLRAARGWG